MSQKQLEQFDIVVQSKAKHAILWELVERFGSVKNAAKEVGVTQNTFSTWLNLRIMPKTTKKSRKTIKRAYVRLVELTGRSIEEIFPGFVRERLCDIPRTHVRRVSVNLVAMTDAREKQLALEAPESELPTAEDLASKAELKAMLADMLRFLPKRQKQIIERRFGFQDGRDWTLEETGKSLDPPIGKERVRMLEARAIRSLRQAQNKRRLASFVGAEETKEE